MFSRKAMAAESSLPLRMMPTWRHMRSRICARAAVTAGVVNPSSGWAETAAEDLLECDAGEAPAADDFATCVRAERVALAAVNFAECATAERAADEFANEFADEFECVAEVACAGIPSCECESGLGAGLPGRVDVLNLTGCAPF